jgi:hypothetical protein
MTPFRVRPSCGDSFRQAIENTMVPSIEFSIGVVIGEVATPLINRMPPGSLSTARRMRVVNLICFIRRSRIVDDIAACCAIIRCDPDNIRHAR